MLKIKSVEVAYQMVYGQGYVSWEWLPHNALRSTLHPLLYAIPIWILKITFLDFNLLIKWIPNFIQVLMFAIADFSYLRFLKRIFVEKRKSKFKLFIFKFLLKI